MPRPLAVWNSARDVWETPETEQLFCEHLDVFSETFPTSGMTRNGVAYALPTWEPAMDGSVSLSLLPTVTTSETTGPGSGPNKTGGDNLRTAVTLLPTPTTQDGANNGGPSQFDRNTPPLNTRVLMLQTPTAALAGGVQSLEVQVGGRKQFKEIQLEKSPLLPTPSACVANDGESTETWLARRERVKLTGVNGNGMGMPLTIATQLIGETTPQPSGDGSAPSDGQLPGQLNLLDAITATD